MKSLIALLLLLCVATFAQNTFNDPRDGKKYKIVKIGTQTWMAENLNYAGEDEDIGACPDDDPKNCPKYGRLYDWENAMLACPDGWHLPSLEEWQTLAASAGGKETAGQKLKARNGWEKWDCEWTATDDRGRTKKLSKCNSDNYGFSALPSSSKNTLGVWWTATENWSGAVSSYMLNNSIEIMSTNHSKSNKLSVRCLKGEGKLPDKLAAKQTAMATAEAEKKAVNAMEAANPLTTEVTNEGTILQGSTLARKLAWLERNAESHNTYIIEVNANENIAPYKFEYKGAINITIVLRGDYENRTIRLSTNGTMFTVTSNVTFILDNNITLHGHNGNKGNVIDVKGGVLKMNTGATITGNAGGEGGGVYVESGTFEMTGGTISDNGRNANFRGGGVDVRGTFTMSGGTISGNKASEGGGVSVYHGTFNMSNGIISGNVASKNGGGVYVERGTFTMTGGNIFDNTASRGGGVHLNYRFTMRSGAITGNTANENGGGVYVSDNWREAFTKTGGTITGYKDDQSNGNIVRDIDGVLVRRGHAVYINDNKRKEFTIESGVNLSSDDKGGWDD
ncbi:MAG: hypothetical protein LBQ76_09495 [Candidatus Fibromonas sp.]|jgi:uncharacterized protein (TIGR02145 family)|nr:hypothetical protein [Candidatus Fibromonas sp.]